MTQPDPRLILGLDLPDAAQARAMAERLAGEVGFFKIGLGMLASGGLDLAAGLKGEGARVFLDLDAALILPGAVARLVEIRAERAFEAGADGVIASPREAAAIRALPAAAGRLIVTPGVRPAGAALGDQKRVASPAEAIRAGADHIVVARPILAAPDPVAAARAILAELRTA